MMMLLLMMMMVVVMMMWKELSKRVDWPPRQIERWWRRRRNQGKMSEMRRFRETRSVLIDLLFIIAALFIVILIIISFLSTDESYFPFNDLTLLIG